jgi:hypothetical protein
MWYTCTGINDYIECKLCQTEHISTVNETCLYAYPMQIINNYRLILGTAHYYHNTVIFMLVMFLYILEP